MITVETATFNQGRLVWRDSTNPDGALGQDEVGSDISINNNQNVTRIAAFDVDPDVATTMRFWNHPATESIEDWVDANPGYTMRLQSTTEGPYELTHHSGGARYNSWQTDDSDTQDFVAALRTGHRFIFVLAEPLPTALAGAANAGSVTLAGDLEAVPATDLAGAMDAGAGLPRWRLGGRADYRTSMRRHRW